MTKLKKSSKILRIATRQSPLALWQANFIREQLLQYWPNLTIELLPMTTTGDQFLKDKLLKIGGKGLFVKELEDALLDNRADLAVHSMKDVPASLPNGLTLTAICKRENPLDAFISTNYTSILTLPLNAAVGTSSLRRQSQLLAMRPDLNVIALRGNIHTRIAKLTTDGLDAILLAVAGLERMGLDHLITEKLSETRMIPACGQGALGIECRLDDDETLSLVAPLNDALSALCVQTERKLNALLGGNCHMPLGVYCKPVSSSTLSLCAVVASTNGQLVIKENMVGATTNSIQLAQKCAENLLTRGAAGLLATQ